MPDTHTQVTHPHTAEVWVFNKTFTEVVNLHFVCLTERAPLTSTVMLVYGWETVCHSASVLPHGEGKITFHLEKSLVLPPPPPESFLE